MAFDQQKIVVITGASSGIGEACARRFAKAGARLILVARRLERITALAEALAEQFGSQVLPLSLDVSDSGKVKQTFCHLPEAWQAIDILVNNAGLARGTDPIQTADLANWDAMIDTNMKGLLYVTRAVLPGMLARKTGHVINIGSIAGHEYYPGGNVYCATKHAVKALTKTLLIDLLGTPVRVSSVDPGAVETEFSEVRWQDKARAKAYYDDFTPLVADDIADAVVYCASCPPHVTIAEMVVLPTDQASTNHIHRTTEIAL